MRKEAMFWVGVCAVAVWLAHQLWAVNGWRVGCAFVFLFMLNTIVLYISALNTKSIQGLAVLTGVTEDES